MSAKFVIDANVLIQAFVGESDSARVETILQALAKPEPDMLCAPEFCILECVNILWKQVRFNGMPPAEAQRSIKEMSELPLTLLPTIDLLPRAFTIGITHQMAIYDSLYIALAESLGCPLLTVDQRQATVATLNNVLVKPITDFPEFIEDQSN